MDNTGIQRARFKMSSLADVPAAASVLLEAAHQAQIVLFEGEMGAGKTTLIKEICLQLGVRENVSSPTFALVNEYEAAEGNLIYHFDFYRIREEREALDIGAPEYFESGRLCLIEWPSMIPNLLPEHYLLVTLQADAENQARTMTINQV
ncbi:tRNA (adenosine(37)-N6)-threonylcarbamoyltransferase complex ATPase subunit type 1 TsaE [Pontibacter sp. E15-1]|uniref:tRNA (adenosine(37)-N6)-threonylcarbamoyltransferase complex ATPase subunit type 1 TsaE n=1 Tax=Pontibacter sp. E15-1 TaxID=2919918 RepID=UPI001F4F6D9E|nr:tRNA (adenosine(37)-N6)-threonylcarbamoyltransferase complex ATPase subunit type 1 TsaE [Pontibacter sp. E15-1]MCJ8164421.1 tRNA (adenosine(37)-N6)-threonylcarbamoyltransferase complex ATPase subunit type 1 TsaE [Pontibacter sp. E15-1]